MTQSKDDKKRKILHVAFTLHDQKIQKWLFQIIKRTNTKDNDVFVITTPEEEAVFRKNLAKTIQIFVCPHPSLHKGAFLRFINTHLKNNGPYDAIHAHSFIMAGHVLLQAYRAEIPQRIHHAHLDRRKRERASSLLKKLSHKVSKMLINRLTTHGYAANEASANQIYGAGWRRDGRWKIMPYGVHLNPIQKEVLRDLKLQLGLPARAKIITQVADFYFEKNHALTLDLFKVEAQKNLSLFLILQGVGPLKEKVQQKIISIGLDQKVLFLDYETDVSEVLSMTDILMIPSLYETDLDLLIEAQIKNVNCLVSDEVPTSDTLMTEHIFKVPLNADIVVWHNAFENLLNREVETAEDFIKGLEKSDYNILNNAKTYRELYKTV